MRTLWYATYAIIFALNYESTVLVLLDAAPAVDDDDDDDDDDDNDNDDGIGNTILLFFKFDHLQLNSMIIVLFFKQLFLLWLFISSNIELGNHFSR